MKVSILTVKNPVFLEGHWEELDASSIDAFYLPDHPCMNVHDPWSFLAYVAGKTERIKLGAHMTAGPQHHPTELARVIAAVDAVSKGRVIVGMGANYNHEDFLPFGFGNRPPFSDRLERMEEMIRIMKLLWTKDSVEFEGRWFEYKGGATLQQKPVQDPHPPIMIGFNVAGKMLDVAVREASEMNTCLLGPDAVAELARAAAERCEKAGRAPLRLSSDVWFYPGLDEKSADETVRGISNFAQGHGRAGKATKWDVSGALYGTPEQMVEQAKRFADVGVEELTVNVESVEQMRWLSKKVIPGIASL